MKCNFCNSIIPDGDLYCSLCGNQTVENACPVCEIGLGGNDRYCPQCGSESNFLMSGILRPLCDAISQESDL